MDSLFFDFINQFGYFAVGALIFIENVFPPIPSEVILPLSGFFTTTTDMVLPLVIASATAGSVLGAFILYGIGYVLSRERLMRFFETRPMRLLGFKGDDIASAVDWFDRKGQFTVLICRCVPVVRSLISIPAGTARMNPVKFTLFTLVGSAVWNTILCSLGAAAGSPGTDQGDGLGGEVSGRSTGAGAASRTGAGAGAAARVVGAGHQRQSQAGCQSQRQKFFHKDPPSKFAKLFLYFYFHKMNSLYIASIYSFKNLISIF